MGAEGKRGERMGSGREAFKFIVGTLEERGRDGGRVLSEEGGQGGIGEIEGFLWGDREGGMLPRASEVAGVGGLESRGRGHE